MSLTGYHLKVVVVSAGDLSGTIGSTNPWVELHYDGQRESTTVKERDLDPEWNETFFFKVSEKAILSGLTLEAFVYNVDKVKDTKSFLGKVQLSETYFARSSDAITMKHPLKSPMFFGVKGWLLLKVYLINLLPEKDGPPEEGWNSLSAVCPSIDPTEDSRLTKEIKRSFDGRRIVEEMGHVFVRVVKARDLPDVKATGSINPYVEVKVGPCKGVTEYLKKQQNPEWNTTFAFFIKSRTDDIEVALMDQDFVRNDFIGKVCFNRNDIPTLLPHDVPLEPEWYKLPKRCGERTQAKLMLAVWQRMQDDEAYLDAWKSDSSNVNASERCHTNAKVYDSPDLWYARVKIKEIDGIAIDEANISEVFVKASMGNKNWITKMVKKPTTNLFWDEERDEHLFVVAKPFEDVLKLSVMACVGAKEEEEISQIAIPLTSFKKRVDNHCIKPQWHDLHKPVATDDDDRGDLGKCGRIRLCIYLDGGYHVQEDGPSHVSDLRPTFKQLWNPPIGLLEIGILNASNMINVKETLNLYCVVKYGRKWVRTRTVSNSCSPVFNEQYAWDVYDLATCLSIGVFDNCQFGKKSSEPNKDAKFGKVKLGLSSLETGRVYAHIYPLQVLQRSGVKKMGELQLSIRFSSTSLTKMLQMWSRPILPQMHYDRPISDDQLPLLRAEAIEIVAARLSQLEPPIRREVVEYMCEGDTSWSLRKSKTNFFRLMLVFSSLISLCRWFDRVRLWRNPMTTLLVHAFFVTAILYPRFMSILILLCFYLTILRNYMRRSPQPLRLDMVAACGDVWFPDELDEELTCPRDWDFDVVRMRYDRLRHIAGRLQTIADDFACEGERIEALVSWRDPRVTALFCSFALMAAIVLYFAPFKVLVAIAGFYIMRHPRLRWTGPSIFVNFFRRLPTKVDTLL